jgi:predicted metal-dependent HD superfamily phosphohydrolase
MMDLKEKFQQLCLQFTKDQNLINDLWFEIDKKYTEKGRHYHHLEHLKNMFSELESVQNQISGFNSVSFSIFYHDVIYNASSKSNEEKSGDFARVRLQKLGIDTHSIEKIYSQILATKTHQKSDDNDTNYLLDADLSVLGYDSHMYSAYTQNIRKEYSIYPDFLYRPGRKKVLEHFLALEHIFKTDYFKEKYEKQARENIRLEINLL